MERAEHVSLSDGGTSPDGRYVSVVSWAAGTWLAPYALELGCGRGGVGAARKRQLLGWTWDRAVGTEDATIARLRPQAHTTTGAFVEKDTSIRRHEFDGRVTAIRTRKRGLDDWRGLHRLTPNDQVNRAPATDGWRRSDRIRPRLKIRSDDKPTGDRRVAGCPPVGVRATGWTALGLPTRYPLCCILRRHDGVDFEFNQVLPVSHPFFKQLRIFRFHELIARCQVLIDPTRDVH